MPCTRPLLRAIALIASLSFAPWASAQKSGGVLRIYARDNPPSASIHEETTSSTLTPFMPMFNNLVVFDQQTKRSEPGNIRPDLATQWTWDSSGRSLTFKLHAGVTWHDGKPFTSADVKCTWDTVRGKRDAGWRKDPRAAWYTNLEDVVTNGDLEVTFKLGRPQPSFLSYLASGFSPVYPCHVDGRTMRTAPIGTGPFVLAEFKPNELIRLIKNRAYFKKGKPHLDGITYRIIPNQGTRVLAFATNEFDMTWNDVTEEISKDILKQQPKAVCEIPVTPTTGQLLVNPKAEALKDPRFRKALALLVDRAAINTVTSQGKAKIGGVMMSPPDGAWGLTPQQLAEAPGYGSDVEKNRAAAKKLMQELGYGPDKPLKLKMMVVNRANQTTPTVLFIDQLRTAYIDASMDAVDISVWTQRVSRVADYELSYWSSAPALDDPDAIFYEGYKCGSPRNYSGYCDKKTDEMIDEQSQTTDPAKRRTLVQAIDRKLQMESARPVIHGSTLGHCKYPHVKGVVHATNSIYNTFRYEDAWLDK
jgi:peptide/nickel transport system substrate-binding protein